MFVLSSSFAYGQTLNPNDLSIQNLNQPQGVAVDYLGHIYVADTGDNVINEYDQNGNLIRQFGEPGSSITLANPEGVAVDKFGNVIVSDTNNDRALIFPQQGNVRIFHYSAPSQTDVPYKPKAAILDNFGNAYIGDSYNSKVWKMDSQNNISTLGTSTLTHDPQGIAVDSIGDIYVTDHSLNQIYEFSSSGGLLQQINSTFLQQPEGISVDAYDNIYVANTGDNDILIFDKNGNLIMKSVSGASKCNPFNEPEDIAVDSFGNVYIADTGDNTVIKIGISDIAQYLRQEVTLNSEWCFQQEGAPTALAPYLAILQNYTESESLLANKTTTLQIPEWIKNNAGWWATGQVGDSDFVKGIQYLIQNGIMQIPPTNSTNNSSQQIPSWVKTNAEWWANGQISDSDFIKGIQYLVSNNIIVISSQQSQNSTSTTTSICSGPTQQNPGAVSEGWYGPGWYYHPGFGESPSQALHYSSQASFVVAQQQYGTQLVQQASVNHCST